MEGTATYANTQQLKNQFIFNSLNDAVLIETAQGEVEYVNTSFCKLFKITTAPINLVGTNGRQTAATSFLFKNPSRFIYRMDEIAAAADVVENEEITLSDGRNIYRDYFPIIINTQLTGHLWVYKTSLLTPEPQHQQLHQQVLDAIPTPIAILDTEGKYLYANTAALPDKNKRSFIIGKTEIEFYSYYNLDTTIANNRSQQLHSAILLKSYQSYIETSFDKKGKATYTEIAWHPLLNTDGNVEVVLQTMLNVTVLKEKEEELTQTIHHYNSILNKLNDIVLLADESLQVHVTNDAWKRLLGTEKNNLTNDIFTHIPLKKYDFYKNAFSVLDGSLQKAEGKIHLVQKNGHTKWFRYSIGTSITHKSNKGIVAVLNDITNEIQLEENLLAVVKREKELNDIKSAFVNMVSHELRTPLAVISSGAELIQMHLAMGSPKADIEAHAAQIISEVERMTSFMNDLLMVSKIEAGKIDFRPQETSLLLFVNQLAATYYQPWKDGRQLTVTAKGIERLVPADTTMLRHVLQNLLDNAFKYSPGQKPPILRVRYSPHYVSLSVADNGIGIHKQDITKLFTSFSRGSNVAGIAGTGMGLVVAKYFTDQHKGHIYIRSSIGKGTVFTVQIPYV